MSARVASVAPRAAIADPSRERARALAAAALAAVGESVLWALAARALVLSIATNDGGPLAWPPVFCVIFALGALAAVRFRRSSALPPVAVACAVAVGLVQIAVIRPIDPLAAILIVAFSLGLALRVVMLGLRDWRDPVGGAFGWGSLVLLVEIALAGRMRVSAYVPVAVPIFFLGALASRATTMRPRVGTTTAGAGARWWSVTTGALGGVAAGMAIALVLGVRGGILQGLGRVAVPVGIVALVLGAFVATDRKAPEKVRETGGTMAVAMILLSLTVAIGIARLLRSSRKGAFRITTAIPRNAHLHSGEGAARIIGMVLLLGIALLLVRAFRARWVEGDDHAARSDPPMPRASVLHPPRGASRRTARRRRELPRATVRRWYVDALDALARVGLTRGPARTPREFSGDVSRALAACGPAFAALTAAYNEVRYGGRTFDAEALRALEAPRDDLMRTLAVTAPIEDAPGADGDPGPRTAGERRP